MFFSPESIFIWSSLVLLLSSLILTFPRGLERIASICRSSAREPECTGAPFNRGLRHRIERRKSRLLRWVIWGAGVEAIDK